MRRTTRPAANLYPRSELTSVLRCFCLLAALAAMGLCASSGAAGQSGASRGADQAASNDSQANAKPELQHRENGDEDNSTEVVTEGKGHSTLPRDVSGAYSLGKPEEAIQISLQRNELRGYLSKQGDSESDRGAQLTYFFARTSVDAERLRFTTHKIHGIWYSFEGTINRGPGKSWAEEGFYLLEGTLIKHDDAAQDAQRRTVSLKSTRQM